MRISLIQLIRLSRLIVRWRLSVVILLNAADRNATMVMMVMRVMLMMKKERTVHAVSLMTDHVALVDMKVQIARLAVVFQRTERNPANSARLDPDPVRTDLLADAFLRMERNLGNVLLDLVRDPDPARTALLVVVFLRTVRSHVNSGLLEPAQARVKSGHVELRATAALADLRPLMLVKA
jgi:hypothetical protein